MGRKWDECKPAKRAKEFRNDLARRGLRYCARSATPNDGGEELAAVLLGYVPRCFGGAGLEPRRKCLLLNCHPEAKCVDTKRAICHEAGHVIAALHFGLRVDRIEVLRGTPRSLIALNGSREALIVLASGVAAEQVVFGNYDLQACGRDEKTISQYGGGKIADLLPDAGDVIRAHTECLKQLRKVLTQNWVAHQAECEVESNFDACPDALTFELLSHDQINRLCPEFLNDPR